jgi:hypothetical protein
VLVGCSLHQSHGKRWVGLPGRPVIDPDGRHLVDENTGKRRWAATVQIPDPNRRATFQRVALAAVDQMLGAGLRAIERDAP